jgi:hypothetical protein
MLSTHVQCLRNTTDVEITKAFGIFRKFPRTNSDWRCLALGYVNANMLRDVKLFSPVEVYRHFRMYGFNLL